MIKMKVWLVIVLLSLSASIILAEDYLEEGMVVDYNNGKLTIQANNIFLTDLFAEIYLVTDVEFQYDPDALPERIGTIKFEQLPLREGIKALLKQAGIKNYTFATDNEGTITAVDILAEMDSAAADNFLPGAAETREEQAGIEPEYEEEDIYNLAEEEGPVFTRREKYIYPEEEETAVTETPAVTAEQEPAVSETEPVEIVNIIGVYGEEGRTGTRSGSRSSLEKKERVTYTSPLPDMSDQYRPPGAPRKREISDESPEGIQGPLPDMSDRYHPPGSRQED